MLTRRGVNVALGAAIAVYVAVLVALIAFLWRFGTEVGFGGFAAFGFVVLVVTCIGVAIARAVPQHATPGDEPPSQLDEWDRGYSAHDEAAHLARPKHH